MENAENSGSVDSPFEIGPHLDNLLLFPAPLYAYGLVVGERWATDGALLLWASGYPVYSLFVIGRLFRGGARDHAAWALACLPFGFVGLAPYAIALADPFNSQHAIVLGPIFFFCGLLAVIMARRIALVGWPSWLRKFTLVLATAGCMTTSLSLVWLGVLGALMPFWDPPPGAFVMGPVMVVACLPLALLFGWSALRLIASLRGRTVSSPT
jgi:hypothetical protein